MPTRGCLGMHPYQIHGPGYIDLGGFTLTAVLASHYFQGWSAQYPLGAQVQLYADTRSDPPYGKKQTWSIDSPALLRNGHMRSSELTVSGTLVVSGNSTGTLRAYADGILVKSQTFSAGNNAFRVDFSGVMGIRWYKLEATYNGVDPMGCLAFLGTTVSARPCGWEPVPTRGDWNAF